MIMNTIDEDISQPRLTTNTLKLELVTQEISDRDIMTDENRRQTDCERLPVRPIAIDSERVGEGRREGQVQQTDWHRMHQIC